MIITFFYLFADVRCLWCDVIQFSLHPGSFNSFTHALTHSLIYPPPFPLCCVMVVLPALCCLVHPILYVDTHIRSDMIIVTIFPDISASFPSCCVWCVIPLLPRSSYPSLLYSHTHALKRRLDFNAFLINLLSSISLLLCDVLFINCLFHAIPHFYTHTHTQTLTWLFLYPHTHSNVDLTIMLPSLIYLYRLPLVVWFALPSLPLSSYPLPLQTHTQKNHIKRWLDHLFTHSHKRRLDHNVVSPYSICIYSSCCVLFRPSVPRSSDPLFLYSHTRPDMIIITLFTLAYLLGGC